MHTATSLLAWLILLWQRFIETADGRWIKRTVEKLVKARPPERGTVMTHVAGIPTTLRAPSMAFQHCCVLQLMRLQGHP
jgi:hypothetical protein